MTAATMLARRVVMATEDPSLPRQALALMRDVGQVAVALPGARVDADGRLALTLVRADGGGHLWVGRPSVSDPASGRGDGTEILLEPDPGGPDPTSLRFEVRGGTDPRTGAAQVVVEAAVDVASRGAAKEAWARALEPLARLLAAHLAAGPLVEEPSASSQEAAAPQGAVREHRTASATAPAAAGTSDPLAALRDLVPQELRRPLTIAATVIVVGWVLGGRRRPS